MGKSYNHTDQNDPFSGHQSKYDFYLKSNTHGDLILNPDDT